ncbi:molybdate ABC transporter substrate-binding protein [Natronincola ferrireducens]|uniref:Molybdate transport system substrate-binding protein n=1 Tax=Natronincola ferrireducens TaxID=393762 RepID=A0A1G8ZRS6_9FIRM|nr:molybdate ABC transporter substrate-binding protein [Natronincola ferrireducens]SDK17035.1 molybdate transport system substrate-binding protein [Natronincola ferrireducens]
MKKRNLLQIIIISLVLSITITACSSPQNKGKQLTEKNELHIAAAASLRFAFEEIGMVFEEETNTKVIFQFGSSGNLAQQIINGAPIDLFVAADTKFVEDLIENGDIIEETKNVYAIGRIVLAVNRNANIEATTLEDLLSSDIKHIALANPNHAPYGLAGKEALENKGLWDLMEEKLVYGENASQTMQFVQMGNAPVGIIPLSIANVEEIDFFLIDEELHNPIEQMLGVVSHSNNQEFAKDFAKFVNSTEGRIIMKKYGFDLP